jgi:hypothetical protein
LSADKLRQAPNHVPPPPIKIILDKQFPSRYHTNKEDTIMFYTKLPANRQFEPIVIASTNPDVDVSATAEHIWPTGGAYTYRTAAAVIAFASAEAADTTQTATITGLDATYAPISETITLNGTTTVNTVNSYLRVHSVELSAATAGAVAGGTIVTIAAGQTRWDAAIYTVPLGYIAYLVNVSAAVIADTAEVEVLARYRTNGAPFKNAYVGVVTELNNLDHTFAAPVYLPEKTDIDLQAVNSSVANARVHGSFELWLSKNV